jgi:hypothetical protein
MSESPINNGVNDRVQICGRYEFECRDAHGNLKWVDHIDNLIPTVGKNFLLDTAIAGVGYTANGPFMGLISSVSYSAIAAADTMQSHPGWTEAGSTNAPTFAARLSMNGFFNTAASGAKSSGTMSFTMTSAGTLKGVFVVIGTGAVATLMNTVGTMLSIGLFAAGDKVVANTDVVNATLTVTLT